MNPFFFHCAEMAEGNGEIIEEMATTNKTDGNGEPERTPDYPKLVEYGLDKRVSRAFSHFDDYDFKKRSIASFESYEYNIK